MLGAGVFAGAGGAGPAAGPARQRCRRGPPDGGLPGGDRPAGPGLRGGRGRQRPRRGRLAVLGRPNTSAPARVARPGAANPVPDRVGHALAGHLPAAGGRGPRRRDLPVGIGLRGGLFLPLGPRSRDAAAGAGGRAHRDGDLVGRDPGEAAQGSRPPASLPAAGRRPSGRMSKALRKGVGRREGNHREAGVWANDLRPNEPRLDHGSSERLKHPTPGLGDRGAAGRLRLAAPAARGRVGTGGREGARESGMTSPIFFARRETLPQKHRIGEYQVMTLGSRRGLRPGGCLRRLRHPCGRHAGTRAPAAAGPRERLGVSARLAMLPRPAIRDAARHRLELIRRRASMSLFLVLRKLRERWLGQGRKGKRRRSQPPLGQVRPNVEALEERMAPAVTPVPLVVPNSQIILPTNAPANQPINTPAVAVDPVNPQRLVAISSTNTVDPTTGRLGLVGSYSLDGGKDWRAFDIGGTNGVPRGGTITDPAKIGLPNTQFDVA